MIMVELITLAESSQTLSRHQFLKMGGTADTHVYYVEQGSLSVFLLNDGEEQIIRFGYSGELIVALDAFLTDAPSDLYIQALRQTTVLVIPKARVLAFIDANEDHRRLWIQTLEQLVLQQMERERDLLTASPRVRYQRVFARSPRLFQEIPHKYIANYLRMTPETLSRLKKS